MGETTATWRGAVGARAWDAVSDALRRRARRALDEARALFARFQDMDQAAWRALARAHARRLVAPIPINHGAALLVAPLAMGLGAASYLGLETEPPVWPAAAFALLAAGAYASAKARDSAPWIARAAALAGLFAAGFALTDLRAARLETPRVAERSAPYEVEGWVERIDAQSAGRRRYWIRVVSLDGAHTHIPKRVRMGAAAGDVRLGDAVRVRAVLAPPRGPPVPGAYDFARASHFNQLGGSGYALGRLTPAPDLVIAGAAARGRALVSFRGRIAERLRRSGGGDAGGVLAALMTGDRSEITPEITEALRVAGLGHILAISGLHLALVGGGAFFTLSWLLAAIEPLSRRMNVRKLAAAGALTATFAYFVISGASTPTQRAFVMAAVAFGAILADRRALTQRGVAIAALIVLMLAPESAATPGFQMSFGAVVALVAANDMHRARLRDGEYRAREPGVVGSAKRFIGGVSSTSLIAGLATAPFAAYHFNRFATYGFAANFFAMPVFTALVMPSATIACLLAPLGLEAAPAWVSARAIELVVYLAERAASYPGAIGPTAAAPPIALALATVALVAGAVLGRGRWRLAVPLALASALAWRAAPPGDLWLGENGGWLAHVDGPQGEEWVGEIGRGETYGAELFLRRAGAEGSAILRPEQARAFACDPAGCVGRIDDKVVVVAERWSAVMADCARADIVLTPGWPSARVRTRCAGAVLTPRRGRGDHGGVIDLGAPEPVLIAAGGAGRPWREATRER